MLDILGLVGQLNRPKLLVQSARIGVDDYSRDQHLGRILRRPAPPRPGEAILHLLELERDLDTKRREDRADYSIARHVEVLIAIMGEARILRAVTRA
ncbi:DUF6477 family protein [Marivivens marinus]|uniref:DUF6477 family protein n=1 Tax=Marivivens marinus TaxID=3110173 RepID=UPI003B84893C